MKRIMHYNLFVAPAEEAACVRELGGVRVLGREGPHSPGSSFRRTATVMLHLEFERLSWPHVQRVAEKYDRSSHLDDLPREPQEKCVFTEDEVDAAELLAVIIGRRPLDFINVHGGMVYDYTVAPTDESPAPWCWQMTPRLMRARDLPKPELGLHQTIPGEVLVHKRLVDSVPGLSREPVRLGPVVVAGAATDWFQLKAAPIMPMYDQVTTGVRWPPHGHPENPPPVSPPNVFDMSSEGYWPTYRRSHVLRLFGSLPPVTFTRELYGRWGPGDLKDQLAPPQPRLIVDQPTRQRLMAAGVSRLTYVPIRLLE